MAVLCDAAPSDRASIPPALLAMCCADYPALQMKRVALWWTWVPPLRASVLRVTTPPSPSFHRYVTPLRRACTHVAICARAHARADMFACACARARARVCVCVCVYVLQVVGVNADSGEVYTSAAARMLRPKVNLRSCFDYGIGACLRALSCCPWPLYWASLQACSRMYRCLCACAVTDWDSLEQVWRTGFKQLSSNASEHPVIVADSAFSLAGQREKMVCVRVRMCVCVGVGVC
ncbi:hypothetical protein EON67_04510 [archaeon]|nr:MAG: hypothetical protein EON67_04510 [archaeon]